MRGQFRALVAAVLLTACADQVTGQFDPATTDAGSGASQETDIGSSGSGQVLDLGAGDTAETGSLALPELCDGIDNDLDGLIDEAGVDTRCGDCELHQGQGHAWWVCEGVLDWTSASTSCERFGATLGVIKDQQTQDFVASILREGGFWLGAVQSDNPDVWVWNDGSSVAYANWGLNQPDEWVPGQDCLRIMLGFDAPWFDGAWDDLGCYEPQEVICSAPHQP